MSFKPEMQVRSDPKWYDNMLRFETKAEAEEYVVDLAARWTQVTDYRVVEVEDPVNYTWTNDRLMPLGAPPDVVGVREDNKDRPDLTEAFESSLKK